MPTDADPVNENPEAEQEALLDAGGETVGEEGGERLVEGPNPA